MAHIFLPLHVWDREFDSRLVLAVIGAIENHISYIGHEYNMAKLYDVKLKNKMLFRAGGPLDHNVRGVWHRKITENGGIVLTQDEEGVNNLPLEFHKNEDKNTVSLDMPKVREALHVNRSSPEAFENVKYQIAWSRLQRAYTAHITEDIESRSIAVNRIVSRSGIRFDLLGRFGRKLNLRLSQSIINIFGDYVLVLDNFSVKRTVETDPTNDLHQARYTDIEVKNFIDAHKNNKKQEEKARKDFSQVIIKLAEVNPSTKFILRPHPVLDPKFWMEEFGGQKNIVVIGGGSVTPWIYGAKCTIHSGCTTGLEAYGAEIPTADISRLIGERHSSIKTSLIGQSPSKPPNINELNKWLREAVQKQPRKSFTAPQQGQSSQSMQEKEIIKDNSYEKIIELFERNTIEVSNEISRRLNLANGEELLGRNSGISQIAREIKALGKHHEENIEYHANCQILNKTPQIAPNSEKSRMVEIKEIAGRVHDIINTFKSYGIYLPKLKVEKIGVNLFVIKKAQIKV